MPGFIHCKQCFDSSNFANPGSIRRTFAAPGGRVKHTTLSFSPVAAASYLYVNPFRNALSTSIDAIIHYFRHATSDARSR